MNTIPETTSKGAGHGSDGRSARDAQATRVGGLTSSPGVLLQQLRFAERTVLRACSIACEGGSKAATPEEAEEIRKLCAEVRNYAGEIDAGLAPVLHIDSEVERIAIGFAKLLEFLYESGGKTRYRLSNLLEAAEHLQLRDLMLEDEAVAQKLDAFGILCRSYENVVMRNGLCLKKHPLKDHVEYFVENTRVAEAAHQDGKAA